MLNLKRVTSTVEREQGNKLPVFVLNFTPVLDYTTFAAEFTVTEGDIVFHFYVTEEVNKRPDVNRYWKEVFPSVLEPIVKEHFNADFPRVKAAYTEEKGSWWLRAYGFGHLLDPHKVVYMFLDKLDLDTLQSRRLFRSDRQSYEAFVAWVDPAAGQLITRRESPTEHPNFFVRTFGAPVTDAAAGEATLTSTRRAITRIADPTPEVRGITKRIVNYKDDPPSYQELGGA